MSDDLISKEILHQNIAGESMGNEDLRGEYENWTA